MIDAGALFFFNGHEDAIPLYEALETQIFHQIDGVKVKTQKTQITFSNRYGFAFVSFLPARPARLRPKTYITVSFGLDRRVDSPRIDRASEPYPNRWTHHVLVSDPAEIDGELMGWIVQAAEFSARKGRRNA